ncbi:MAG: 30S ribosomal protein S2 [Mycoplasma sp.]
MEKSRQQKTVESEVSKKTSENAELSPGKNLNVDANSTKSETQLISANKLITVGAHIGLHPSKWNPKMKPYIYTQKQNNHIIDVTKSLIFLRLACDFLQQTSAKGGKVLIVGTRGKLIKDYIKDEAIRSNSFFVTQRWLGGTLTNFKNIRKSIKKMNDNNKAIKDGTINNYTKKEQLMISKETEKLEKFYGGIGNMRTLPSVLLTVDPVNDTNAIMEAKKLGIPVVSLANTNADPKLIDYIVPVNNYSIKSVVLLLNILVDAINLGQGLETKVIGVPENEIVIVEQPVRKPRTFVNHKRFTNHH